jgi:hypothetical protein
MKQKDTYFPVSQYLVKFTQETMPGLLESMKSNSEVKEFLRILEQVLFCHRYNKGDTFLAKPLLDYAIIRDPLYKYSNAAKDTFFQVPVLTFLFAWFCQADEARVFMLERGEESQTADFGEQLLSEA